MIDTNSSCREFVQGIASKTPIPGGGSASALVGAFGVALGNMVAVYTVGKKKYAEVNDEMAAYVEKLGEIQQRLMELVQEDMDAFEPLSKLYKVKDDTAEHRARMQRALLDACMVPVNIMDQCGKALDIIAEIAVKGNRLVISDAAAGAVTCKAAIEAASLSVYINTMTFEDRELAEKINQECNQKVAHYRELADRIYTDISNTFVEN